MTFKPAEWPRKLRSPEWFGGTTRDHIYHRSWMKNQGLPADLFDGRPVIGICNTWSELTPCNAHLRDLAQRVKHGIYEAGGLPVEFPVFSTGESALRPTAMMYRNLAAMDVEEAIRANPVDGVVLMVGCDKTTPALLMGAASVDLPAIVVTGGPMLNGWFRGERVGSGTALWQMSEAVKAGTMSAGRFPRRGAGDVALARLVQHHGHGHRTMASMTEALGMALSGNAAIPAVDSRRRVMAQLTGRRIVEMVKDDLKPSDILTREAFENAIRVNGAIGGSTNAVIHLLAIAGRVGIDLTLDDWDRLGRDVPTIVNLMPSGKYLMEEFFYAGGLPVVIKALGEAGLLNRDALTVSGETAWEQVKDAQQLERGRHPPGRQGADRAGRHRRAARQSRAQRRGAEAFRRFAASDEPSRPGRRVRGYRRLQAQDRRSTLDIDENCVMVLKNCGPHGYPGMAEVGNMGLPPKVLKKGITDMVRISDARMSGTAYGTVVLHTTPEAAVGGPLAVVRDGDMIELDVPEPAACISTFRKPNWRTAWPPGSPRIDVPAGGYARLYHDHVEGADTGADFDFLKGCRGSAVGKDFALRPESEGSRFGDPCGRRGLD